MNKKILLIVYSIVAILCVDCKHTSKIENPVEANNPALGLKDHFKNDFSIGVAVSARSLHTDEANLILREFNTMTAENAMKMERIHPAEYAYDFRAADSIVDFAQKHKILLRGHNLSWHQQAPAWMFLDNGKTVSKEVLLKRLKDHITTVVSRYKGKIFAWDVVNEAISDNPNEYLRNSQWYKICGEEYIARAFEFAHQADPNAILFYNDYNEINPVKRDKIYRLVKELKAAGIPIHGVGFQGHWSVKEPSEEQLENTIEKFSDLGIKLHITELDISVYPKEHDSREKRSGDVNTSFTPEREQEQIEMYKRCFRIFKRHSELISNVTFWNISDRHSWLDNFPVRNRKDYPLLFDTQLKPKKAYYEVIAIARE